MSVTHTYFVQWRCVISLRTSSRRDAFQLTGRKASLSICTRAKGMLWIEATTGAWSWLSKWWRCWSVWWRDSSGKELRSIRCSVFMSGRGTTDAIFIVRQLQEKHLAANKLLYMAFVDLEKAFGRVPRDVIWWAMRKQGIDEWLVRLVQSMYKDVRSRVRVGDGYSEEFRVGVGVHQGSVLSPLLFIIVLEALSREFRTGCPWELLYADDLMISAESMEELLVKVQTWKTRDGEKGPTCKHGEDKDYGVWH